MFTSAACRRTRRSAGPTIRCSRPSSAIDAQLARLVFHELAHQLVYVKNDTTFNESFAVTVEEEGVRRWLEAEKARGAGGVQLRPGAQA